MLQEKLNGLVILCIEKHLLVKLDLIISTYFWDARKMVKIYKN